MDLKEICAKYVAFLRALYVLHQNHHWVTQGAGFYQNHLLFERIYKTAQENADLAAEKFIGLFGAESLAVDAHPKLMMEILNSYKGKSLVEASLAAEKDFLGFSDKVYSEFKGNLKDKMTLGLDDMIMSIASQREESVYLLQSSLGDEMNKLSTLAAKFQKKLAQVANHAAPAMPNPNAGPQNGEEARAALSDMKLQEVGEAIKAELMESLAMKNLQPGDLKFTKLRFVDSNGVKAIEWSMAVSPNAAKQFQAGVANQKATNPTFSVPRYVTQLFGQKMPGVAVLPAQPITVG